MPATLERLIVTLAVLLVAACAGPSPTSTPTPSPTAQPTPSPTSTTAPASATPTASLPSLTPTATITPATPTGSPIGPTSVPPTPGIPNAWNEVPFFDGSNPGTRINGIAYGNDVFIAVGVANHTSPKAAVWVSRNGMVWVEVGQRSFPESFDAVTFDGSNFFAFGSAPTTVWKSNGTEKWQQVALPQTGGGELGSFNAFTGGSVSEATTAGGNMYAAGDANVTGGDIACSCVVAWRSSNGTEWTQSTVADDDTFQAFAATPELALVISSGTYIGQALHESTDFDSWAAPDTTLIEGTGYLDAAAGDDRIVAVGYAGDEFNIPLALTWADGLWSSTSFDEHADGPAEQVTWMDGLFVAVGTGEGVIVSWSSRDGFTWTPGPDVGPALSLDLGELGGDDPFNHRAIGGGSPGVVLAQTGDDELHVWFAPAGTFAAGL